MGLPKSLQNDAELAAVVEAWPGLAGNVRRAVLALIEAARG